MNPSNTVTRARAEADKPTLAPIHPAPSNSQTFSNVVAHGSSRLHLGNNYYVTYSCSASHDFARPSSEKTSPAEHLARTSQKRKRSVDDVGICMKGAGSRTSLATVLESLGEYSKSIQQLKDGDKGKEIAAQLQYILRAVSQAGQDKEDSADLDREVQKLHHQLQVSRRIRINGAAPRPLMTELRKASSKVFCVASGHWAISLTIKTLTSQATHGQTRIETCSVLRVQHSSGGSSISTFFGERDEVDHVTTISPVVMAYNQIDSGGKVFELVRRDDLDDLFRLLAIGEASLRDCDRNGRSLLHYACKHGSVNVCKFLVETGAEIDLYTPCLDDCSLLGTPLFLCTFNFQDILEPQSQDRMLECQKALLRAGADPTLPSKFSEEEQQISALFDCLGSMASPGPIEPLTQVLRESMPFFDIRTIRENGETIWQRACRDARFLPSSEILRVLVNAGVDTDTVDEYDRNCLFDCTLRASDPQHHAEFTALRFLLTVFDDINARDCYDSTIFDLLLDADDYPDPDIGSYRHDLWYCALFRSGIALRLKIPPPTWKTTFAGEYKPKHYRALLYLDTWDFLRYRTQPIHPLWRHFPSSAQERQQAPAFHQWNLSDLLMMEERGLYGCYCDDRGDLLVYECSDLSSEGSEDESTGIAEEDRGYISEGEAHYRSSETLEEESNKMAEP